MMYMYFTCVVHVLYMYCAFTVHVLSCIYFACTSVPQAIIVLHMCSSTCTVHVLYMCCHAYILHVLLSLRL